MSKPTPLERSVALCGVLLGVLQSAGSAMPPSGRDDTAANQAIETPSESSYGYYCTVWRPWPGEVRPDVSFPQSVGAELIPTPAGEKQLPPSKIRLLPGESPVDGRSLPPGALPAPFLPEPPIEVPGESPAEVPAEPPAENPAERPLKAPGAAPSQGTSLLGLPLHANLFGLLLLAEANGIQSKPGPPASAAILPAAPARSPLSTRAHSGLLTVYVPYDAKVTINALPTRTEGSRRRYVSYGLRPGLGYKYLIRVEVAENGRLLEDFRTIVLTAGDHEGVAFGFNLTSDVRLEPQP
jgi:uncharacterized protein (TIGR03000 family)